MTIYYRPILTIALLFLLCLSGGCSISPRVSYYTLNPAAAEEVKNSTVESVQIASINIPEMIERPHLVVRTSPNRVEVMEFHRWAETLKTEIPRIVAENMTRTLKKTRVFIFPDAGGSNSGVKIALDFRRFELTTNDGVTVDLFWTISNSSDETLKSGHSVATQKIESVDYYALVAAISRALATVSVEISGVVADLKSKGAQ